MSQTRELVAQYREIQSEIDQIEERLGKVASRLESKVKYVADKYIHATTLGNGGLAFGDVVYEGFEILGDSVDVKRTDYTMDSHTDLSFVMPVDLLFLEGEALESAISKVRKNAEEQECLKTAKRVAERRAQLERELESLK